MLLPPFMPTTMCARKGGLFESRSDCQTRSIFPARPAQSLSQACVGMKITYFSIHIFAGTTECVLPVHARHTWAGMDRWRGKRHNRADGQPGVATDEWTPAVNSATGELAMRLLSYNIHKGIGGRDRLYRLNRIVEVIEAENPDLICLQEVDRNVRRSRHDDQPKLLAEYFKAAAHLYQLNVHLKDGGYGNLLLSRWPFQSHHQISIRYNSNKPRGAQMAVIESPEGPFQLVNWHLGLAERMRHWQVNHLLDHHLFREAAHLPTLIAGDYNDWRNTLHRGPFAKHRFVQATAPMFRFRSFPAYAAMGSLDKLFYRGSIVIRHARIVRTALAKWASDHLPLVVDFHLANGGSPELLESKPPAGPIH